MNVDRCFKRVRLVSRTVDVLSWRTARARVGDLHLRWRRLHSNIGPHMLAQAHCVNIAVDIIAAHPSHYWNIDLYWIPFWQVVDPAIEIRTLTRMSSNEAAR